MASNTTPPLDLTAILKSLSSNIQDVMVSWYEVQTASLRESSQSGLLVAPLRKHLQAHWEHIRSYLQKCHEFGEEVIIWQKTFQQGPESDGFSLLEELKSSSDEMCQESEVLMRQSASGIDILSSVTPQLLDLLRGPSKYAEKAPSAPPETTAFLGLGSPQHGLAAIARTTSALAEVQNNLCMLHNFWTAASATCRSFLTTNTNITQQDATHLGQTWKEWQEEIRCANVSIAKSLDAGAVEPAAPPVSPPAPAPPFASHTYRRQQRRRGSSKSDASLPASLPRKMSGLDDDGVSRTCWGFSFRRK
ncbi:hypothetical protein DFH07DRAFT_856492 [Mycena maculata]|uniref:Uncharacterized protein n=1 Tax=Mycena maculata TaxID=230809 RepID=A0AAD7HLH8_9AGAR|nr:hypothetical protein DFH07DRAFT_856492 [Mycena maculata]